MNASYIARAAAKGTAVLLSLLAFGADADAFLDDDDGERLMAEYERFQLFHRCASMGLLVMMDDGKGKGALAADSVEVAARSRLRAARIFDEEGDPVLLVYVTKTRRSGAFAVSLHFSKFMTDLSTGDTRRATTWMHSAVGIDQDNSLLRGLLAEMLDEFVDAYLRVNAESCS